MIENPNVICNDCAYCKENTKLKELLRKAKGIITAYRLTGNQSTYSNDNMKECVAQIEQALGEDK